jgi:predicted dinucleotide-binding enzyme
MMSYAIVGFGKIGQALAHAFARNNINVTVASRVMASKLPFPNAL